MEWFYVKDGQQAGPVTEQQLQALFESGQVTAQTLVWRAGMANWVPLPQAGVSWAPAMVPSSLTPPAGAAPGAGPSLASPFAPAHPVSRPQVVVWYRVYCAVMSVLYLVLAFLGIVILTMGGDLQLPNAANPAEMRFIGLAYTIMGFVFFIPFALALVFPYRKWSWIYGIVMIGLGMTSCICLPVTIPLLIYWLKPETRLFFSQS